MTKRELIPTAIRTEFGEVLDAPSFYDTNGAAQDHTYTPGYSDLRRARDLAVALREAEHMATSTDDGEAARGRQNIATISDRIRQSLAVAGIELPKGRVHAEDVPSLPVRLQLVRTSKVVSGHPDNTKEVDYGSAGYRMVKKSDIGQPWLRELPQGSTIQADGSIKNGDTTLMVCDAKRAARNAAVNQLAIRSQTQRTMAPMESLGKPGQTFSDSEAGEPIPAAKPLNKQ